MQLLATGARTRGAGPPLVCIGIFAWNEEKVIGATLASLFQQSLFGYLEKAGQHCEIFCVLNGCTDQTARVAKLLFDTQQSAHPHSPAFTCQVANLSERGKINAWNQYVHAISNPGARFLFMMDADISLHRPDTLWNMLRALDQNTEASVSVDRPRKDVEFKTRKSPGDYVSLAMSRLTKSAPGQLCGQLYCIRSEIARKIWLPKDLAACEDGFIKAMVCTDFVTRPASVNRIVVAGGAEHVFEAYKSPLAIFKNQKRQVIGQTIVHILVDQFCRSLPEAERQQLGVVLRANETADPQWLKRLIHEHLLRVKHAWQLYPGLLVQRFKHLRGLPMFKRVLLFPAASAGASFTLAASFAARSSLRAGDTKYWPKAQRGFPQPQPISDVPASRVSLQPE